MPRKKKEQQKSEENNDDGDDSAAEEEETPEKAKRSTRGAGKNNGKWRKLGRWKINIVPSIVNCSDVITNQP